jgi:hypothetical protein
MKLLVNQKEAADMRWACRELLQKHVRPHIKRVEAQGMRFPVSELERWVDRNSQVP